MGAAYFYHLTRAPLEVTLETLLKKSLQVEWRVAVRGTDPERLRWLDEKLSQHAFVVLLFYRGFW